MRKKIVFTTLLVLSSALFSPSFALAATYIVAQDSTGNFSTIQSGVNAARNPGDSVLVRNGVYNENQIVVGYSGNANAPIIIQSAPGEKPQIHGSIRIENKQFITFSGFDISFTPSSFDGAIYVRSSNHITVSNNTVHDTESYAGINVRYSTSNTVENNVVSRGRIGIVDYSSTYDVIIVNRVFDNDKARGDSDGIVVFGPNSRFNIIKNNTVHDNSDDGIDTWNGRHQVIFGNIVYQNGYLVGGAVGDDGNGLKLGGRDADGSGGGHLAVNNMVFRNRTMGITTNGGPVANAVYHNVSYGNLQYGYEEWSGSGGSSFINNIAYQNSRGSFTFAPDTVSRNNLFSGNPMFINATQGDFHLSAGSPAIDAGASLTEADIPPVFLDVAHPEFFRSEVLALLSHDADGKVRPQDSGADIGAFEYSISTGNLIKQFFTVFLTSDSSSDYNRDTKVNALDAAILFTYLN